MKKDINVHKLDNSMYTTLYASTDYNFDLEICKDARLKFYGEDFNEKDFKELRKILNERRGDMYTLWKVYFVCPKTLECDCQLGIGKKQATALIKAHKASKFATVDIDLLELHCEEIMEFEKKKDLKKAVETIKEAFDND